MNNLSYDHEERAKTVENVISNLSVKTILDVGCGPGTITNRLLGYEVSAIDPNLDYLKQVDCKEKIEGSIDNIPFGDGTFDLVLCTSVLEHLPDKTLMEGIQELKRVSKRYLLISTPYMEDLRLGYMKCGNCGGMFNVYGHRRSFLYKELIGLFQDYKVLEGRLTGKGMNRWDESLLEQRLLIGGMTFRQTHCLHCGVFNRKKQQYTTAEVRMIKKLESWNNRKMKNVKRIPSHVIILFEKG